MHAQSEQCAVGNRNRNHAVRTGVALCYVECGRGALDIARLTSSQDRELGVGAGEGADDVEMVGRGCIRCSVGAYYMSYMPVLWVAQ